MGDFNSQPFSVPYHLMRFHANMSDSFLETHPSANSHPSTVDPQVGIDEYGMSCDSSLNSWSGPKNISANITAQGGKRLDYIFHRGPAMARRRPLIWGYRDDPGPSAGSSQSQTQVDEDGWPTDAKLEQGKTIPQSVSQAPKLRCKSSRLVFQENVPGTNFSYSDHFGLYSTFNIDSPQSSTPGRSTASGSTGADFKANGSGSSTFTPLVPLMSSEAEPLTEETTTFAPVLPGSPTSSPRTSTSQASLSSKSYLIRSALTTLREYSRISQRVSSLHLKIFGAVVLALVALTVGSAWQPKSWLQPIFTLLGGVCGAAGATFLYTGFVWGKWELGLLTETMEEMELELRVVEMEERGK